MDPDEALKSAREACQRVIAAIDNNLEDAADDLATYFQGLDEWISQGGFLPYDWEQWQRSES